MAYWNNLKFRTRTYTNTFGDGVNTYLTPFEIKDGETVDSLNMCSDDYPAIRTRNDRIYYSSQLTTPRGMGKRTNSQLHVADGINWKYWNSATSNFVTLSTSLSSTDAEIMDFPRGTGRTTLFWNSSQARYWDGAASSALAFTSTDLPMTKLFTVHKGRIFALKDAVLYFSALNLIDDWTSVLDAGAMDVTRAVGNGTAITTYANHVVIWCDNSMHELYGTDYANYELMDITNDVGCVGQRTVVEVKGLLFWLDYTGVFQYTGGQPRKISDKVQKYIEGINWTYKHLIAAGTKDDKLYLSIPYAATSCNRVLVYDTRTFKWNVEDGSYINFVNIDDTLYGQAANGFIYNMDNGLKTGLDNSTAISWNYVTKAYNDGTISGEKTLSNLYLAAEGTTVATRLVEFSTRINSTASTDYSTIVNSTFLSSEPSVVRTVIPYNSLQNVNWYKFRVRGTGHVKVHSIEKTFRVKVR